MKITGGQNGIVKFDKAVFLLFFFVIVTGFLIRCSFICHESLWPDEALYMFIGENLATDPLQLKDEMGRPFFQNPPLFMYILSFLFRLTGGGSIMKAHLITVLMDMGTILLIWHIGNHFYGKYVGFLSAGLLALNPLQVWMSTRILTDVPLVLFVYLSLYFLICRKNALFLPWIAFRVSRYSLPLYPAILMFAAYGGINSFSYLKKVMPTRIVPLTMVFGAILFYVLSVYCMRGYAVTDINSKTFVGYKEAGIFLTKQGGKRSILTSSPRQIKYFAPEFTVYDLPKHITLEESRRLIIEKEIDYMSVDRWSPHQPDWCRDNSLFEKYFQTVYNNKNIVIFKLL